MTYATTVQSNYVTVAGSITNVQLLGDDATWATRDGTHYNDDGMRAVGYDFGTNYLSNLP